MSKAIAPGSPLAILFSTWLARGRTLASENAAEEDAIADSLGVGVWEHNADVVTNMPQPSPANVSLSGAGNGE